MYTPHRDERFEYVFEAMSHVEEKQCETCVFRRTDDPDYPMCFEISGQFILELPVEEINDLGSDGLACTKYRPGNPTPEQVEGQEELF